MSKSASQDQYRAGELLRRIAQLVSLAEDATPEIRVGDADELTALESALPGGIPPALKTMYSESDPVSLTVPLAGEDLDFIPCQDVTDVILEESVGADFVPFARAGKALLCLKTATDSEDGPSDGVFALQRVGTSWEVEPAGASLDSFLAVLSEILDRLSTESGSAEAGTGERSATLGFEVSPESLVEIEGAVEATDPEHTDFWMSLLS